MFISNVELIRGLNHSTSISFMPNTVLGSGLSVTGETDRGLSQGANLYWAVSKQINSHPSAIQRIEIDGLDHG